MDSAMDVDGNPVSIEKIRGMTVVPDLWCPGELPNGEECGGKAWPTALNSTVRSATFAAHHQPGCDHGSEKSEPLPGDAGHPHRQGTRAPRWRMRFGGAEASPARAGRHQPNDRRPGSSTHRYRADPALGDMDSADTHSFSTMLVDLMADTLPDPLELVLGAREPIDATSLIVHARDAVLTEWEDRELIIWGEVDGLAWTKYDGLMIRLKESADGVAILIVKKQLELLMIADPNILLGRHVIAYGTYKRGARWPHVRAVYGTLAFNPRVVRRRR